VSVGVHGDSHATADGRPMAAAVSGLKTDLRELEARLDARLQTVSNRFTRVEQRLITLEAAGNLDTAVVAEIAATVAAVLLRAGVRSTE